MRRGRRLSDWEHTSNMIAAIVKTQCPKAKNLGPIDFLPADLRKMIEVPRISVSQARAMFG